MSILRINPPDLPPPRGFSQVVKTANTIYIAGQVGRDKDGKIVGSGKAQIEQAFNNLKAALEAVDCTMSNLVKATVFMTHREDIPAYREVRAKYIPDEESPAVTLILCAGLADPALRFEIEAIAVRS